MTDDIISNEQIEQAIQVVRGQRVLLDTDLASLYGVPAKVLNQAVKRNLDRFPEDFMFQLTQEEAESSRLQIVTLDSAQNSRSQAVTSKRGSNIKYLPYAFTEQGVAMLFSILRSTQAQP
ncbi:ORF6N domain-containing protein [Candidatus Cyanaurora vandensis]|uniref:ORF6N domain-containing protein n=1 Tax=Candidatus Cyanaurora vandensis TaxID=2714958 RepID=UPI00257F60BE|nr:ORF6N domain-containing protein [Candidatus Cyanaurora vandensis]